MSKHQISLQVEFEQDDLQKLKFSANTKILGGDLVAIDFDGLAFVRANLLDDAIKLLDDIRYDDCLQANPEYVTRFRELVEEVKKYE